MPAATTGEIPDPVVTRTSTTPTPGGDTAVTFDADTTVNEAAATAPNDTPLTPKNRDPVIVTVVPPAAGPPAGASAVTAGAATYRYFAAAATGDVPPGVVTRTSTTPAACFGAVTTTLVAEATLNAVPETPPERHLRGPQQPRPRDRHPRAARRHPRPWDTNPTSGTLTRTPALCAVRADPNATGTPIEGLAPTRIDITAATTVDTTRDTRRARPITRLQQLDTRPDRTLNPAPTPATNV